MHRLLSMNATDSEIHTLVDDTCITINVALNRKQMNHLICWYDTALHILKQVENMNILVITGPIRI